MVRTLFMSSVMALSAQAVFSAPVQWTSASGGNDHWYDFVVVAGGGTVNGEVAAENSQFLGLQGYLVTITTAAEQAFLNTLWPGAGSVSGQFGDLSFFMIGASDRDEEGTFRWIGGPEEGQELIYENWAPGEPNNFGGTETYAVAWWEDDAGGQWNDAGADPQTRAYVVEYSAALPPVPLPGTLPLLLAGAGALTLLRRRSN